MNTLQFHTWEFVGFKSWRCKSCPAKSKEPTKGLDAKRTCPGAYSKIKGGGNYR